MSPTKIRSCDFVLVENANSKYKLAKILPVLFRKDVVE
jgi:hypothetical protein